MRDFEAMKCRVAPRRLQWKSLELQDRCVAKTQMEEPRFKPLIVFPSDSSSNKASI